MMQFLIDMNLTPDWVEVFAKYGWHAIHWSTVGNPQAPDSVIMNWARTNEYIVFTHDLDFGALLATTQTGGPSVVQIRTQNVMPDHLERLLIPILKQYETQLESGALIVIDEGRCRVRILPLLS